MNQNIVGFAKIMGKCLMLAKKNLRAAEVDINRW
jgi:hypothetical protein